MENAIKNILVDMDEYLTSHQLQKLQRVLVSRLSEKQQNLAEISNYKYLTMFLDAKKIEGCSARTIAHYETTVAKMLAMINDSIRKITTDDIRKYLADYQQINNCSKTTVDNIRRNISSFYLVRRGRLYYQKSNA